MKRVFLLPSVLLFAVSVNAQAKKTTTRATPAKTATSATAGTGLKTNADSVSYAFGVFLGENLKSLGIDKVNYALLNSAITKSLAKQPTLLDMSQCNAVLQGVSQRMTVKKAGGEKERGRVFLEQNKNKAGVTTTASGLQYEILTKGTGPIPKATDTVVAHYKGALLDGKEFDNSYSRGEPITIPVTGVIPGWTEALQLMPVGSKWKLYIPSSLGYGDYGAGQDIPGGATLVFEVELVGIGSKKAQ